MPQIKGHRPPFYTKEEDLIIINQVKNYPTNLKNAFKEASKLITRRTLRAIEMRWYTKLSKQGAVITCGSNKGFTSNTKNICVDKNTGIMPEQNLKHYLFIVKEILELPQNERDIIIKLFSIK